MDKAKISEIVKRLASEAGLDICETAYSRRREKLNVVVDKPGGVTVDECAMLSRGISGVLCGEDYANLKILVSSPGLDRPLSTAEEFRRKIAFNVVILKKNGSKMEGRITKVKGNNVFVEGPLEEQVALDDIEEAKVVI